MLSAGFFVLMLVLGHAFSEYLWRLELQGRADRALGLYNPSETSDAYFVLSNDRNEVWFICNRHLRTYALLPEEKHFRFTIKEFVKEGFS